MGRWGGRDCSRAGARDAAPSKEQAIKLVTNLLYARRNGDVKKEQAAYEKLRNWCAANNVNMENAIAGVERMKGQSIAALMGGLV